MALRGVAPTGILQSSTWAAIGSAATAGNGATRLVTNLGENGTIMVSNGTRWRPLGGSAILKGLAVPASGIVAAETIVLQTLIPAALLQAGDTLRWWMTLNKSGTTDTLTLALRVGTAGTTSDTGISGVGGSAYLSAAQQSGGFTFDLNVVSATTIRKAGTGGAVTGYSGGSATAENVATTVSNVSNALYATMTLASSGATNTVGASTAWVELLTP